MLDFCKDIDTTGMIEGSFVPAPLPTKKKKKIHPFAKIIVRSRRNPLVCPECKASLIITKVNVSRCTNIGGPWKSSIMCTNDDCRYTELSTRTIKELVR